MRTKRFILDATELVDQRRLEGAHFRLLVHAQKLLGDRICIPEVVVREYVRRTRARLGEEAAKLAGAARELGRMIGRHVSIESVDIDTEARHWESWLRTHLKGLGVEVLPIPDIALDELLRRDLARKKPFNQDGKGFRDAVIWESALQQARVHRDVDVIFVTTNAGDFADGDSLHSDLRADFDGKADVSPIALARGLKAAIDVHVQGRLAPSDPGLKDRFTSIAGPGDVLQTWMIENLGSRIEAVRLPAGFSIETVGVQRVKSVRSIRIVEARTVGDDKFAEVEAALVADLALQKAPPEVPDASPLFLAGRAFLTHLMLTDTKITVRFTITIDAQWKPSSVDVWDAQWDDDATKLFPLTVSPSFFGS